MSVRNKLRSHKTVPRKVSSLRTLAFGLIVLVLGTLSWIQNANRPNNITDRKPLLTIQTQAQAQAQDHTNKKALSQTPNKNRRSFVSYQSSTLEQLWLDHVDKWAASRSICSQLLVDQEQILRELIELTCTSPMPIPYDHWCVIDDEYVPLWFNMANTSAFEFHVRRPDVIPASIAIPPSQPVRPGVHHEHLVSKFTFLDEQTGEQYVEYIEPLVSHLRFPLSQCITFEFPSNYSNYDGGEQWEMILSPMLTRGYVIPPPNLERHNRHYYFDAGSSSWNTGGGGPSLNYFVKMWDRHGVNFTEIYAYEMTTPMETFYKDVPSTFMDRTHYQQCAVSSSRQNHSRTTPFIPFVIEQKTTPDDYVFFKLDIDSALVELGSILFIIDDQNTHIDEIAWEHHVSGNYLMAGPWGSVSDTTLRESYQFFLTLRQKGIRAHSWI